MIQTPELDELHAIKYRGQGESHKECCNRVAATLAPGEAFHAFRDVLLTGRFMPGGRIQSAVGSTRRVTPFSCFVSGTIADSFVDGHGSIMQRATEAAATMRMGGGIGYNFGTLRPRGDVIRKLGSQSSGPVSFMSIFNAVCEATSSSGHRRGAQMGVMPIWHPDIEEFIRAKQNSGKLLGFNVSVAVTDEFMRCLKTGTMFPLRWGGKIYREVDPQALWEMLMRSTWDWAEPGVLFIDRINDMNNLSYCEEIAACNPCGEQQLPPHGACLLGSFNLVKYLVCEGDFAVENGSGQWYFDWPRFMVDIPVVVAAMDRVTDIASYPLHEQEEEAHGKRRMGLGVTGLANALEALGLPYGTEDFVRFETKVLETLRDEAYRASALLAAQRGPFPRFNLNAYLDAPFIRTLPSDVRNLIVEHGIRNSHLLSIAPTGTISLCADNVSSGIEPVIAYEADRTLTLFDGPRVMRVHDYGKKFLGVEGRLAEDISAAEHLAVLVAAQSMVDSSVSKTCNVPSTMPWDDFKALYQKAWEQGCKGCTTYQVGGKREAVICRVDGSCEG